MEQQAGVEQLRRLGAQAQRTERPTGTPIPLAFDGVVFRQTFEYAVADFLGEAGFYVEVFGLSIIAFSDDYALFTPAGHDYFVAVRNAGDDFPLARLDGIRMCLMTGDFESAESHLRDHPLAPASAVRMGSPVQRVLDITTPAGLAIEIWEDPAPGRA